MTTPAVSARSRSDKSTIAEDGAIRPFSVEIPKEQLDDLRRRIVATRWPEKETVTDATQGVQLATIQELARYWASEYDFNRVEKRLNALPQFRTVIDGLEIHFIHVKSPHENALPVIITHSWPGSVIEMLKVVGPLSDPTTHGGDAEDAFDVIVSRVISLARGMRMRPARPARERARRVVRGRSARLPLVRVARVSDEQVGQWHPQRVVLHLPHVAQLVANQVAVVRQPRRAKQDQVPHRVPVEPAKPRQTKQPARDHDPDPVDPDWTVVEPERIKACLGSSQRRSGLRAIHAHIMIATSETSEPLAAPSPNRRHPRPRNAEPLP